MTPEEIQRIEQQIEEESRTADKILDGDWDNYDARTVRELCETCRELIEEVKDLQSQVAELKDPCTC